MTILGIESSCDETAAAVVRDGVDVLSNIVASQQELHSRYGGVVPEVACRAHIEAITPVIEEAVEKAGFTFNEIDAVAVTVSPGLIGALLIGLSAAKALAWHIQRPLLGVNHIRAHIYANVLDGRPIDFPAVALIVSGGHTVLYRCISHLDQEILGSTTDDAAGEAFDKVASILGLGYPGGPVIDRWARKGNPKAVHFKRTYLDPDQFDFSFSGIKTAVLYHVKGQNSAVKAARPPLSEQEIADVAASFQEAVVDVLVDKALLAARRCQAKCIVLGGGVACNSRLRAKFAEKTAGQDIPVFWPSLESCTDNAAMIAGLAYHKWLAGQLSDLSLDVNPTPVRAGATVKS